jgi:hypothetical protein
MWRVQYFLVEIPPHDAGTELWLKAGSALIPNEVKGKQFNRQSKSISHPRPVRKRNLRISANMEWSFIAAHIQSVLEREDLA